MNDRAARRAADEPRLWIDEDSDAVFAAAIRAGVLSEDPQHEDYVGHYMYMHHDAEGVAWFKHRETRAYVTLPREAYIEATADQPKRAAGPGKGLWATVVLAGVFLAGGLVDLDRGGPRIGTVRLNDLTAEFYAEAVRNSDSPEAAAVAARDWGMQLEAALDEVAARHGAVLLPTEAVAAGAGDYTIEVRAAMQWAAPGRTAPGTVAPGGTEPQPPETGR